MYDGATILVAHPDDEVIFMWPALKRAARMIACSSDKDNPARPWCARRTEAFREVGRLLGIETVVIDGPSEFYRLPTRPKAELKEHLQRIIDSLGGSHSLFTHNAWGEYGHLDHILVHQVALGAGVPVFTTTARVESNWTPPLGRPQGAMVARYQAQAFDPAFYAEIEAVYHSFDCWTWSKPPIEAMDVVQVL